MASLAASSSSKISSDAIQSFQNFLDLDYDHYETSLVDFRLPDEALRPWKEEQVQPKLVEVVRFLGPALTSEDEQQRLKAVVLLSLLVTNLAEDDRTNVQLFDKQAVTTLATFFASKIEDGNTIASNIATSLNAKTDVIPGSAPEIRRQRYPTGTEMLVASLKALLVMSKLSGFASEAAKAAAENLVKHSTPRVHPQAIRFLIYTLMDSLLTRHRSALKALGTDFVKGYIELVEGEKDPRNLVYIFAMDRVILIEWDNFDREMIESFFDVTYCYFPITFKPPPGEPYGISTDSLRRSLRRVLTASPSLASHALPLLIEKMQASGGNAKRDTLDTLAEALPVFGRSAALAHAQELWQGFRIEIMHATDEATAICATRALESLLFVLYLDETEADGLATEIVADVLDELEEPSKQQAKPAATIIGALIRATPATSKLAIHGAIDQLLVMYKETDDFNTRPSILNHLNTLFKAMREVFAEKGEEQEKRDADLMTKEESKFTFAKPSTQESPGPRKILGPARAYESDGKPLSAYHDIIISTLSHALRTANTQASAVDTFITLTHIGMLNLEEVRYLCESVNGLLVDASSEAVREQAVGGLRDLALPSVIEETTLPLLFNALPDRIEATQAADVEKIKGTIRRSLGALTQLCEQPPFFEMLVVRLGTKLDLVFGSNSEYRSPKHREDNVGYARGIVKTLTVVLLAKARRKDLDIGRHAGVVYHILGSAVESFLRTSNELPGVARDRNVLSELGYLLMLFMRHLDDNKQRELGQALYVALFQGDVRLISNYSPTLSRFLQANSSAKLHILDPDVSQAQRELLCLFASAIVAIKRDACPPPGYLEKCISNLASWTVDAPSRLQEEAGEWLLSDWINKYVTEPVSADLQMVLNAFWSREISRSVKYGIELETSENKDYNGKAGGNARKKRAIRIWLSIARGFLVRNSKYAEAMINNVYDFISTDADDADVTVQHEAALGMGGLLQETRIISKENNSVIRLLYRQRFVTTILPRLLAGHRAGAAKAVQGRHNPQSLQLVAICSLLPHLPRATLLERLTDIFPLLILALDVHDDGHVQASAANVIAFAAATGKRQRDEAILDGRAATAYGRTPKISPEAAMERNSLDLVCDHVSAIIKRLLIIISGGHGIVKESTAHTKIAACRCLSIIARTISYTTLHPYRGEILRKLGTRKHGIDDPKRNVRLEAVDCRDAWFNLKGDSEEK